MAKHVEYLLRFKRMGLPVFDYGNNIRQVALDAGVAEAFDIPGFVPEYIRPLFCRGVGPFRWVALSGDPEDIYKTDAKVKELIPDDPHLHHWLDMARSRIHFQGLPARICWVGLGQRHRLGLAFNEMVKTRRALRAHRDRPRSPGFRFGRKPQSRNRSDEGRLRCRLRLAAAQRPAQYRYRARPGYRFITAAASAWVTRSMPGVVIVCDGSDAAAKRIERVLWNDPGTRRHAACRCRL